MAALVKMDIIDACRDANVGTVTITGLRQFNLRLSVALALIRLASWVAPVGIDVEDDRD